jgi:hypothetical protein
MSLASALLSDAPSFPSFPNIGGLTPNSSVDLAVKRFIQGFRSFDGGGLNIYAGGPDDNDQEIEDYILLNFSTFQFLDWNRNGIYDPVTDEKVTDIDVYISHDGVYLLEQYEAISDSIEVDRIALFLEIPKGDILSDTVLLVLAGENAIKYVSHLFSDNNFDKRLNGRYDLTKAQRMFLLDSLKEKEENILDAVVDIVTSATDYIVDGSLYIADEILESIEIFFGETLRISDSVWNSGDENYLFGSFEDFIIKHIKSQTDKIDNFVDTYSYVIPDWLENGIKSLSTIARGYAIFLESVSGIAEFIVAFVSGVWNALMDLISGLFALIRLVISLIRNILGAATSQMKYLTNQDYYQALFKEYIDNFLQAYVKVDWKDVIKELKDGMSIILDSIKDIPSKLMSSLSNLNHTEIAYGIGYLIFEIVTLICPPLKLTKIGKFGSKIGKISDVFGDLGSAYQKSANAVGKGLKRGFDVILDFFKQLIKEINKGTTSFLALIRKIIERLRVVINKMLGLEVRANLKNITEYQKIYGKLIQKGSVKARSKFDNGVIKIEKQINKQKFKNTKQKLLARNKAIGDHGEDVIQKILKGNRPDNPRSFKTSLTRRFPDNFHKGVLKEVKSGDITLKYKKQILKDIEILAEGDFRIGEELVKKIEWHTFGEVDELVLKFINKELKDRGNIADKFVIIIH